MGSYFESQLAALTMSPGGGQNTGRAPAHTVYVPPGTPAPIRAAINATEQALNQQSELFGRLGDEARHTLAPLQATATRNLEAGVVAPIRARLREQQNAICAIDAQVRSLATAKAHDISRWGTHQITAIVSDLNHKLATITATCGPHSHPAADHGPHGCGLPVAIQSQLLNDLEHGLSAAWQTVQQALDSANHLSGQVSHHRHHMERHSAAPPAVLTDHVNTYSAPVPAQEPTQEPTAPPSPTPPDSPTTTPSPPPADLPSGG